MAKSPEEYAHHEWLGYVQPVGLIVSVPAMLEAQCYINKNIIGEHARFLECLPRDKNDGVVPEINDFAAFAQKCLEWEAEDLKEIPQRVPLPEEMASLEVILPQYHETLRPTHAVSVFKPRVDQIPWEMLIQDLSTGTDFDEPSEADSSRHWHASPQLKFERLLREASVPIGLLCNGRQLRLVYAPRGESSGHATFNVDEMVQVAGRPMFAALHMLLSADRLFTLGEKQRLPAILANSRKYQNTVSTKLAAQVLAALYELMRGFQSANDVRKGELLREVLAHDPNQVYSGLLRVLMRLVFVLYAEDRDLMSGDPVYSNNYSITGLFERLRSDAGRFPDTMDSRFGAWSQLLTLFRLVYEGGQHDSFKLPARKGYLFDPEAFPFLEGRFGRDSASSERSESGASVPRISDGVVYRVLRNLLILDGERLSYRTLDVEQIGSVYETMMGFNLEVAQGQSIAIKPVKSHGAPATINLDELLETKGKNRAKWIKEQTDQKITGQALKDLKAAESIDELLAALDKKIAKKVTPRVVLAGAIVLQPSDERRRSGSHYTPRSLTKPIVETTLQPILKQLVEPPQKEAKGQKTLLDGKGRKTKVQAIKSERDEEAFKLAQEKGSPHPRQILNLKICDPAMGSGAFLVEACRQLGDELVAAWHAHACVPTADIPPDEDEILYARRLVAQRCLYGVDKNPMAVDLSKLSLWLATLAKDHPFTFLDHALRCGDSLVGLGKRQIAGFHWEPKQQKDIEGAIIEERIRRASDYRRQILDAREDVAYLDQESRLALADESLQLVRFLGDLVVSAFFAGQKKKQRLDRCDELFHAVSQWFASNLNPDLRPPLAAAVHALHTGPFPVQPFHWEIEFPEVFDRENGGFDVMVGNPPFINAIDGGVRSEQKEWLKMASNSVSGAADVAFHFLSKAHRLTQVTGSIGFLMPRQFLNTAAGDSLRRELMERRPPIMLHSPDDSSLFQSANVHVVSTVFANNGGCVGGIGVSPVAITLKGSNWWSQLVGEQICDETPSGDRVGDMFSICASMTTQIAYDIKPLVFDAEDDSTPYPRLVTTGLIDPFQCLWGKSRCRYLKDDYERPVIRVTDEVPERVTKRLDVTSRPKILVAGVAGPGNRLEAFLDFKGEFCGAVSTYTVTHATDSLEALRHLCEFLNSAAVSEMIDSHLAGSAMGSGLLTIPKTFLLNLVLPYQQNSTQGDANGD